jgi:hypothetical protein
MGKIHEALQQAMTDMTFVARRRRARRDGDEGLVKFFSEDVGHKWKASEKIAAKERRERKKDDASISVSLRFSVFFCG